MKTVFNLPRILVAGVVGTAVMTLYSYWRAHEEDKQFKEPQLLASLLQRAEKTGLIKKEIGLKEGWALHMAIGVVFAAAYDRAWRNTALAPEVLSGLVLGAAHGVVAVAGWDTFFRLHRNPPEIDFDHFYKQLFIAHLIFGVTAGITYRQVRKVV